MTVGISFSCWWKVFHKKHKFIIRIVFRVSLGDELKSQKQTFQSHIASCAQIAHFPLRLDHLSGRVGSSARPDHRAEFLGPSPTCHTVGSGRVQVGSGQTRFFMYKIRVGSGFGSKNLVRARTFLSCQKHLARARPTH